MSETPRDTPDMILQFPGLTLLAYTWSQRVVLVGKGGFKVAGLTMAQLQQAIDIVKLVRKEQP